MEGFGKLPYFNNIACSTYQRPALARSALKGWLFVVWLSLSVLPTIVNVMVAPLARAVVPLATSERERFVASESLHTLVPFIKDEEDPLNAELK
jgi:hypothetical protein